MQYTNYRDFLQAELDKRKEINTYYSLRSFARDLGISAPRLSQVLSAKKGISAKAADDIADKLRLNKEDMDWFTSSVKAEHSRSQKEKKAFQERFQELQENATTFTNLQLEYFKVISDWYHYAILEMTHIEGFKSDLDWISETLNIDREKVREAINRLKSLELLEEVNGKLVDRFVALMTPNDTPSDSLKKINSQLLKKANEAIYLQGVSEREISSNILSISKEDLPEFKKRIRKFRRNIDKDLSMNKKDTVYSLNIQFFNLTTYQEK